MMPVSKPVAVKRVIRPAPRLSTPGAAVVNSTLPASA